MYILWHILLYSVLFNCFDTKREAADGSINQRDRAELELSYLLFLSISNPANHVGRNSRINLFRVWQIKICHQLNEFTLRLG